MARAASGITRAIGSAVSSTAEELGTVWEASSGSFSRGQARGAVLVKRQDNALAQSLVEDLVADGMTTDEALTYVNSLFDRFGVAC
jgi:hypothetical protein